MSLKFAIIGTGGIADKQLAPALQKTPGCELWSVLSRDLNRGQRFAKRHKAKSKTIAYIDYDALLSDRRLDGVIIASPDKLHAKQAIAAAEAGKHVLVEKPMATSPKDAKAMIDACARNKVVLAVAYHLRWHNGHRMLHKAVSSGALGELRHMRVQWTWQAADASNWRAGGDVGKWWSLAGVGTHCLDMIRWFMVPSCGEVESLKSTVGRSVWGGPHDETAAVSMQFTSGATAEFCSSVLFESPSRVEVYGSKGYAICDGTLGPRGRGRIVTHKGSQQFTAKNPYVGEIRNFHDAIRGKTDAEVDGEEGLRNIELLVKASR